METTFSVLGPVRGRRADAPVDIGSRQARLVLALLLVRVRERVSMHELAGLLWGEDRPATAEAQIDQYAEALSRVIGPALTRDAGGLRLDLDAGSLDLLMFRELASSARAAAERGDPAGAVPLFVEALKLWQGRCATGLEPTSRLHPAFVAVERERAAAAGELAVAALACGEAHAVHEVLRTAADWDPDDEMLQLRVTKLDEEQSRPVERDRHRVRPAQLPATPRLFSGRRPELDVLNQLLRSHGRENGVIAVAVDGIPGSGKSTLAVHWAHSVADEFPDGQLFVNLRGFDAGGPAVDADEALTGFLEAMGVRSAEIPAGMAAKTAFYRSVMARRRMLVVVDNARDAEQVRPLIPGGPGCMVVVTSRNRLEGLAAHDDAHLLTLDVPSLAESREILRRRLGDARVTADPKALDDIIDGCGRLPLAMAVVAARAAGHPHEPLRTVADEIRAGRRTLDAFSGGEPQSDLRTVCSWSYRLLTEPAARVFRLLSVHPGPDFSVPAVASLAGITPGEAGRLLGELTRTRLLTEHAVRRYVFHDLIRVYARELADKTMSSADRRAAWRRLTDHLLLTAHAAQAYLSPPLALPPPPATDPAVSPEPIPDLRSAMTWFTAEHDVVRTVVAATVDYGLVPPWRLAHTLLPFYQRAGLYHAWAATTTVALDAAVVHGDDLGEAHMSRLLAGAENNLDQNEASAGHLLRAQELFERLGRTAERGYALGNLGYVRYSQGRHHRAVEHYQDALDLFLRDGHHQGEAAALHGMSYSLARLGERRKAIWSLQIAVGLYTQAGDRHGTADCTALIADIQQEMGYHNESIGHRLESIRLFAEMDNRTELMSGYYFLAETYQMMGRDADAARSLRRALAVARRAGLAGDDKEVQRFAERLRR